MNQSEGRYDDMNSWNVAYRLKQPQQRGNQFQQLS